MSAAKQQDNQTSGSARVIKDTLAGTCGGIAQVLTGQPFDTVKVRLQTNPNMNMMQCVRQIINQEGYSAFYKGTTAPLVGVGACVSIQFAVSEWGKRFLKSRHPDTPLSYGEYFIAGSWAGLANATVSIPVEHIRIRMQVQTNRAGDKAPYSGSFDAFKKIYQQHGLRGVYKGTPVTLAREFQGYGTYFMVYEWLVRQLTPAGKTVSDLSVPYILFAGACAGYSWWIPVYPLDVIKSKLQTDSFTNPQYKGFADCLQKTLQSQGVRGLYRGFVPCMLRAIPSNSATFLAFELAMRALGRD